MSINNLIIGNTSQLSHYFPESYLRISSRCIDFDFIKKSNLDSVYILFAEQRTFLNENESFFNKINVDYTIDVINKIKDYVKKVVIYSTSELWNNYNGGVFVNDKFDYNYSPYIKSKEILCNTINENKSNYSNINIIYPFNFNSPHRKSGFLFSKIFDSLINKNVNQIGDINFTRDLIHPSVIVKESINTNEDKLIGTGELINIEAYVFDLFNLHNLNYKDYLVSDKDNNLKNIRKNYFSGKSYSNYNELLTLTNKDVYEYKIS